MKQLLHILSNLLSFSFTSIEWNAPCAQEVIEYRKDNGNDIIAWYGS